MVLLLRIDVFQDRLRAGSGSPKTRHIRPAAAWTKPAIASINCFDPFRRCLLYLFDQLSLENGSRQRCDNVNMISNTANAHHFGTQITADHGKISMHPWPYV